MQKLSNLSDTKCIYAIRMYTENATKSEVTLVGWYYLSSSNFIFKKYKKVGIFCKVDGTFGCISSTYISYGRNFSILNNWEERLM